MLGLWINCKLSLPGLAFGLCYIWAALACGLAAAPLGGQGRGRLAAFAGGSLLAAPALGWFYALLKLMAPGAPPLVLGGILWVASLAALLAQWRGLPEICRWAFNWVRRPTLKEVAWLLALPLVLVILIGSWRYLTSPLSEPPAIQAALAARELASDPQARPAPEQLGYQTFLAAALSMGKPASQDFPARVAMVFLAAHLLLALVAMLAPLGGWVAFAAALLVLINPQLQSIFTGCGPAGYGLAGLSLVLGRELLPKWPRFSWRWAWLTVAAYFFLAHSHPLGLGLALLGWLCLWLPSPEPANRQGSRWPGGSELALGALGILLGGWVHLPALAGSPAWPLNPDMAMLRSAGLLGGYLTQLAGGATSGLLSQWQGDGPLFCLLVAGALVLVPLFWLGGKQAPRAVKMAWLVLLGQQSALAGAWDWLAPWLALMLGARPDWRLLAAPPAALAGAWLLGRLLAGPRGQHLHRLAAAATVAALLGLATVHASWNLPHGGMVIDTAEAWIQLASRWGFVYYNDPPPSQAQRDTGLLTDHPALWAYYSQGPLVSAFDPRLLPVLKPGGSQDPGALLKSLGVTDLVLRPAYLSAMAPTPWGRFLQGPVLAPQPRIAPWSWLRAP